MARVATALCEGRVNMTKYKVNYSGFAYVEADSEEEAKELFYDGEEIYKEWEVTDVEEVDDYLVEL